MASSSETKQPGVYIKTFGCQMNEYDTEKMLALLGKEYRAVSTPEEADLVIVNTCSIREKAEHKLFSVLGQYRDLKASKPDMVIGVGGCVAQQEGANVLKRNNAVDFVVGTHNLSLIPSLVRRARAGERGQVAVNYREEWEELPDDFDSLPRAITEEGFSIFPARSTVRALVAIQRGCNKNCTYCVVPNTRGPEVSRLPDEIEREVRLKVRSGAREVLLLGQTVNSYGRDLTPRTSFASLVRRLAAIPDLMRIRFTSPHPAEVRSDFLELYAEVPQLCPHLHLPVQSGSDRILRLMNRNYKIARYREIVNEVREVCPDISLTTDVIVGFPTESEEEFLETLELIREVRYQSAFSFAYSRRPGTAANEKFSQEEEIPVAEQRRRLLLLQAEQELITAEINRQFVGKTTEVLVEGQGSHISSGMKGRNPHNILVEVLGTGMQAGELVPVQVEHGGPHCLRGVPLVAAVRA